MNSMIKVILGMILGVVGYWVFERVVVNAGVANQTSGIQPQVTLMENDVSREQNIKVSDIEEKSGEENMELLINELATLRREMEVKNQELLAANVETKWLSSILKGDSKSRDGLQGEQDSVNNKSSDNLDKFEGIPESHHLLLSRPESMPKATHELHDELVNEEEDIGWATMKEQQISHFLMTHNDSAQYIIHKVECRNSLCEVIGTEHPSERDVWSDVTGQMRSQAWWAFIGTHTSSSTDSDGNLLFVTILQRKQS